MKCNSILSANKSASPNKTRVDLFRRKLLHWAKSNTATFPWRTTTNKFHGLIAEMMLQRTRAEQVQPIYETFVRRFPSPLEAAHAPAADFRKLLRSLGLEWRIRTIRELVTTLAKTTGEIPSSSQELIELPGVGDYVAAAFRTLHLNKSATLIDANIVRLYGRYFGVKTGPETRRN